MTLKGKGGIQYNLSSTPLAAGGEGEIYTINGKPDLVAKVYKSGKAGTEKERKLVRMVDFPPASSVLSQIAWPKDVLYNAGQFVGFVMQKMTINEDLNVVYEYGSSSKYPHMPWENKIIIAQNLCAILVSVHDAGYICGDFNPKNISVDPNTGRITLLDTDSYHIHDGDNTYRCDVGIPEYLPAEIQVKMQGGKTLVTADLPTFTEDSDNFALAVHIFQLLMNGSHPFACIITPSGQSSVTNPERSDNILRGKFPFMMNIQGARIPAFAPTIDSLPKEIQDLFKRAFIDGHKNTSARPSATEWHQALTNLKSQLKNCKANKFHQYYSGLSSCPLCEADQRFSGQMKQSSRPQISQTSFVKAPTPPVSAPQGQSAFKMAQSSTARNVSAPVSQTSSATKRKVKPIETVFSVLFLFFLFAGPFILCPIIGFMGFVISWAVAISSAIIGTCFIEKQYKAAKKSAIKGIIVFSVILAVVLVGRIFWDDIRKTYDSIISSDNSAEVLANIQNLNLPITVTNSTFEKATDLYPYIFWITDDGVLKTGRYMSNNTQFTDEEIVIDSNVRSIENVDRPTIGSIGGAYYIKNDDTLWGYGSNANGILGDGTGVDRESPVQILDNVAKTWYVGDHMNGSFVFALKNDKSLWVWGGGTYSPMHCADDVSNVFVYTAYGYAKAIIQYSSGAVTGWSEIGKELDAHIPFSIYGFEGEIKTETVRKSDGYINKALGIDGYYIDESKTLYRSEWKYEKNKNVEQKTPISENVETIIDLGNYQSYMFIKVDGSLWGFGNNENGQLGDGTKINRDEPVKIADNVYSASSQAFLTASGELWTWDSTNPTPRVILDNVADVRYQPSNIGGVDMVLFIDGRLIITLNGWDRLVKNNLDTTPIEVKNVMMPHTIVVE